MNKLIEKIVERLEEYEHSHLLEHDSEIALHCKDKNCGLQDCSICVMEKAIDIIHEEAKAYNEEFNPTEDIIQYGVDGCMKEYYRRGFEDGKKANNEIKTNADYIRNMSDEELAEMFHNVGSYVNDGEPLIDIWIGEKETTLDDSFGDILDWLKAEREG